MDIVILCKILKLKIKLRKLAWKDMEYPCTQKQSSFVKDFLEKIVLRGMVGLLN